MKVTNTGKQPVEGCTFEVFAVNPKRPCIELGYVFPDLPEAKVPPVPVEIARVLPEGITLASGESKEVTPRLLISGSSPRSGACAAVNPVCRMASDN